MRILVTTNPAYGHFLPMLPLMNAARSAGHEVVVATGADLAPEVQRHGYPVWVVGPTWAEAKREQAEFTADDSERMRRDALALFGRPGIARARELMPLAAHWRPDMVVHELLEVGGCEAAAVSGALDVVHGFGTHVPYLVDLAGLTFDAMARELGKPNRTEALFAAPYVDPCPPILQPPGQAPFTDIRPLRPEVGAVYPGDALPAEMRDLPYQKSIYLTLGTVFNVPELLATAIEAVRGLPYNVIVTAGPGVDPASFGPVPDHIAIASFVPQALIMQHSTAVVSHTGSGTMLGALTAGLPQVCLPIGADQFTNADQVVRTGAGVLVPPAERTSAGIRAAIDQVLDDPAYAMAARRIQNQIAALPTADEVLAGLLAEAASQAA